MDSNASSVAYADRVQALANCPTWAEQVEDADLQSSDPALSYATVREGTNETTNMGPVVEAFDPHVNNTCTPQGQAVPANLCAGEQSTVINNTVISQGPEPMVIRIVSFSHTTILHDSTQ